ncbi:MAG: glucose-6-phosphate isomerase [Gammaproteobacteria bacterium]
MTPIDQLPAWTALRQHHARLDDLSLTKLFASDADRVQGLTFDAAGLHLDLSKNRLDTAVVADLVTLAQQSDLATARSAMFAGAPINSTEGRSVLHVALRAAADRAYHVDGDNVTPAVHTERAKMRGLVDAIRNGDWKGFAGDRITDVVHIGIGGSDLGPRMVTAALAPHHSGPLRVHFVANLDGADLAPLLASLSANSTLFIVASKSFTTMETLTNAMTARRWLLAAAGGDHKAVASHFVALSANPEATSEFGIAEANRLTFWDWVGGRFSLWSVIGMPIALAVGNDGFDALLDGARAMDDHFESAPLASNVPVLMALTGLWYRNFFERPTHAILPYDERLVHLPAYLQQAEMESNGKRVQADGQPVAVDTAPVLWGGTGTNTQHAFFQMLHQGTHWVPADFIAAIRPDHELAEHHAGLLANCLAQTAALMQGDPDASDPHKVFEGNRPSTTILVDSLTPQALGALIAAYEHKIFCQGHFWRVNAFDQFGVQLGKTLAKAVAPALASGTTEGLDASTAALIDRIRKNS